MSRAFVLLGSNIDKERNLAAAVQLLRQMSQVLSVSPVYETLPVGLQDQPNFLNAAVLLETDLEPTIFRSEVLAVVERKLGRQRAADKNAPRTIDLDLILYDDLILEWDGRQLPDPDLARFLHVARPVADLDAKLLHPVTGEPLRRLAARLMDEAMAGNNGQPPLWPRTDVALEEGD